MDSYLFIQIYLPVIIIIGIVQRQKKLLLIITRRRRKFMMSNELLLSCLNKTCNIYTGSLGKTYSKVSVVSVVDNWLKIEKNNKTELINGDYIQNIKILE